MSQARKGPKSVRAGYSSTELTRYAATVPLETDLRAKTLEVWVSLTTLQQAGAASSACRRSTARCSTPSSFGGAQTGRWMAGSDNFVRTQSFRGPAETEADRRPVVDRGHVREDGTITAYRNGRRYGVPYAASRAGRFQAGQRGRVRSA